MPPEARGVRLKCDAASKESTFGVTGGVVDSVIRSCSTPRKLRRGQSMSSKPGIVPCQAEPLALGISDRQSTDARCSLKFITVGHGGMGPAKEDPCRAGRNGAGRSASMLLPPNLPVLGGHLIPVVGRNDCDTGCCSGPITSATSPQLIDVPTDRTAGGRMRCEATVECRR